MIRFFLVRLSIWQIIEAKPLLGERPGLIMKVTHLAAGHSVELTLFAYTALTLSGNTVTAITNFSIKSQDIEGKEAISCDK